MNRRFWPALLLAFPGLVGCTPPGPHEFYRSALQARSEFVDSLSRVVDEKTAKEKYKVAEKVLNDRLSDIKEGLERAKYDGNFQKLSRQNFQIKNVAADDLAGMVDGMKEYLQYCKNVGFTNIRLKREIERLKMVQDMEALNKAKNQIESNQPVAVNKENDFPNLAQMLDSLAKPNQVNLRFVPNVGITTEQLKDLKSGIPEKDLQLILDFDPQNIDAKAPGRDSELQAPKLPPYPAWVPAVAQRAKLKLSQPLGAQ